MFSIFFKTTPIESSDVHRHSMLLAPLLCTRAQGRWPWCTPNRVMPCLCYRYPNKRFEKIKAVNQNAISNTKNRDSVNSAWFSSDRGCHRFCFRDLSDFSGVYDIYLFCGQGDRPARLQLLCNVLHEYPIQARPDGVIRVTVMNWLIDLMIY